MGLFDGHTSATELDSHANMVVIGSHCLKIGDTGQTANVNTFSKEAGGMSEVPIIDAVCAYDCPKSGQTYLLLLRNGLHMPSNDHNLIPPFLMREAGLAVNDKPKIHCENPSVEDHSIYCGDHDLRIPLQLEGIFSYFPTRALTLNEMEYPERLPIICVTPDSQVWNPYDKSYAMNEASYLDPRGDMVYPTPKNYHLLEAADICDMTTAEAMVGAKLCATVADAMASPKIDDPKVAQDRPTSPTTVLEFDEESHIDATIATSEVDLSTGESNFEDTLLFKADPIRAQVADASCVLDPITFQASLNATIAKSKFAEAIGSTSYDDHGCELFATVQRIHGEIQAIFAEATTANASATHAAPPKGISPEILSKVFRIDHDTARRTIDVTTQFNRRDPNSSISRNFSTNDRAQRYRRINSFFFTDTFYVTARAKSKRGNTCMQIFVSDKGYVFVVPMKREAAFPLALKMFAKEVGVPEYLIADPARAQKSKEVVQFCHKIGTTLRILEEGTQHANRAELYVGLMKEAIRKDIRESHSPLVLWDYCAELRSRMFNMTAKNLFQLQGQNPHMATFGTQGDISNICQYKWYEWVYFRDGSQKFPFMQEVLGRYLGPAKNEGNEMTVWILKMNGNVVPRTGLRKLTPGELYDEVERSKRTAFDLAIHARLGNSFSLPPSLATVQEDVNESEWTYDPESDEEPPTIIPDADAAVDATGKPITTNSICDALINCEVLLPQGESTQLARVVRRSLNDNGLHVGKYDDNPILNTAIYDVEFPDGTTKEFGANIIAENILG